MMVSLMDVPRLKGRENYEEWKFAAEKLLILEGVDECLMEPAVAVDAKTLAGLILTMDSSLFVHIEESKTSKESWTELEALFDDSGFSRRIALLRHLISIGLENCEP